MSTYYFLGAHSAISGDNYAHILTKFGEAVELTDDQARNHAFHGARLIPAADFERIAFTPEELEMNSDLLAHDDTADEEFLEKRAAAFEAADQFRMSAAEKFTTSQE